ncbi:hypothetical protein CPAV1605_1187 [seawater metagenome]|uniref:Large-conductance mechanosensitive channel n=1 Tax=seawater metagenome TaxID=1561972 RepID=A0A5E8CJT0_9ZZZZ
MNNNTTFTSFQVSGDLKTLILTGLVATMIGKFVGSITNEFFFPVINDMFGDPKFTFNQLTIDLSQTVNSFLVIVLVYGSLKYGAFLSFKGDNLDFQRKGGQILKNDIFFLVKFMLSLFVMGFLLLVLKTQVFDPYNLKPNKKKLLAKKRVG